MSSWMGVLSFHCGPNLDFIRKERMRDFEGLKWREVLGKRGEPREIKRLLACRNP